MSDKTHLDFNFLDDKPKGDRVVHSPTPEVRQTRPSGSSEKIGLWEYFKSCYSNFVAFSEKHLTQRKPKYLLFAIYLLGLGSTADRVTGSSSDYSSWGEAWAVVLFGGIIAGAVGYYIAGWFYNVRIKWSKGRDDITTSRNIYVFSTLPLSVASILSLIFNHMAYGSSYFNEYSDGTAIDVIFVFVALIALIYSVSISYKAARSVLDAEKNRAIWWFIVAPILFFLAIIIFSVAAA